MYAIAPVGVADVGVPEPSGATVVEVGNVLSLAVWAGLPPAGPATRSAPAITTTESADAPNARMLNGRVDRELLEEIGVSVRGDVAPLVTLTRYRWLRQALRLTNNSPSISTGDR